MSGSARNRGIMRMPIWTCLVLLLMVVAPAPIWAEDDIITDEEMLFGSSEDDLFGEDFISEVDEGSMAVSLEEDFLTSDKVELGGSFDLSLNSTWMWFSDDWTSRLDTPDETSLSVDLGGDLFLDARPSTDFRVFGKADLSYTAAAGEGTAEVRLKELFSDFDLNDRVFLRGGKQTIGWGVGYFFSPADIINIGRIDPENPEAEREGPVALKMHVPVDSNNYYLYAVLDNAETLGGIALAPKAEVVTGGTEIGFGAYYKDSRAPRAMATISSSLGDVAVFGEGVVSYGSDKRFVKEVPYSEQNPLGVVAVERNNEYFVSGTAGFRYSHSDDEGNFRLSLAGQYLYNGEGYENPDILRENALGIGLLMQEGQLHPSDLMMPGRHYLASTLTWSEVLGSDLSASLFWLGNVSDGSGRLAVTVSLRESDHLQNSVGVSTTYGPEGSEFAPFGSTTVLFLRSSFGSGGF